MDVAELRTLLSPEGLRLLDEVGPIEATADVVRIVSRLRGAGHPGDLVAAVSAEQYAGSAACGAYLDVTGPSGTCSLRTRRRPRAPPMASRISMKEQADGPAVEDVHCRNGCKLHSSMLPC